MARKPNEATPGELLGGKISAKEVGYAKADIMALVLADREREHFLYRVIGQGNGTQAYDGEYGEGFAVLGQFEATNRDGEVFNGTSLYLPGFAQNMLVAAIQSGHSAQMALDVYAIFDEEAATSYVFTVRSLIEPDRSAIEEIKKQIGSTPLPALPAK